MVDADLHAEERDAIVEFIEAARKYGQAIDCLGDYRFEDEVRSRPRRWNEM